jgi:hypothetical protein
MPYMGGGFAEGRCISMTSEMITKIRKGVTLEDFDKADEMYTAIKNLKPDSIFNLAVFYKLAFTEGQRQERARRRKTMK